MSVEAEEQLLTKYRGAAWGENWFYHQTALEIVDEAEEVQASAQAMRDLIQDGFPDDADVAHFFFG